MRFYIKIISYDLLFLSVQRSSNISILFNVFDFKEKKKHLYKLGMLVNGSICLSVTCSLLLFNLSLANYRDWFLLLLLKEETFLYQSDERQVGPDREKRNCFSSEFDFSLNRIHTFNHYLKMILKNEVFLKVY